MTAVVNFIRQFQPGDAAVCSQILRSCIELDQHLPAASKHELLRIETPELMCERASLFYLAAYLSGDAVVAVGGVDLNEIRLLYVAPSRWRQGIGGALLAHLESWVPPALFGDIFVYAAPGAVEFYRAHGYRSGGEHVFVVGNESVPTIFMTRTLT